eukprot:scaffold463226_cov18-Prasinocladus_malaysianus.AAC.1
MEWNGLDRYDKKTNDIRYNGEKYTIGNGVSGMHAMRYEINIIKLAERNEMGKSYMTQNENNRNEAKQNGGDGME